MTLEKNSIENFDYMDGHLSQIQKERINKQKDLEHTKKELAKKFVFLIVQLFRESTYESVDVNLNTITLYYGDGGLVVSFKSPSIDGIEYMLNDNDVYNHTSILKNMPNTRQKMREIESILPSKSAIEDINAVFQQDPFSKYFQTEEYPVALEITFCPEVCENN